MNIIVNRCLSTSSTHSPRLWHCQLCNDVHHGVNDDEGYQVVDEVLIRSSQELPVGSGGGVEKRQVREEGGEVRMENKVYIRIIFD